MTRTEKEKKAIETAEAEVKKERRRQNNVLVPRMSQIGKKTKKNQVLQTVSELEENFSHIFASENPLQAIKENESQIKEFISEERASRSAIANKRKIINVDNRSKFLNDLIREVELDSEKVNEILKMDLGLNDNDKKLISLSLNPENTSLCCDQDLTTSQKVSVVQILEYKRGDNSDLNTRDQALNNLMGDNLFNYDALQKVSTIDLGLNEQEKQLLEYAVHPKKKIVCKAGELTNDQKLDLISVMNFQLNGEELQPGQPHPFNEFIKKHQIDERIADTITSMDIGLDKSQKLLIKAAANPDNKALCCDEGLTTNQKLAFLAIDAHRRGDQGMAQQIKNERETTSTQEKIENGILKNDLEYLAVKFSGKKINFIKLIENSSPEAGDKILQLAEKVAKKEKSPSTLWKKLIINLKEFCTKEKAFDMDNIQKYSTNDPKIDKQVKKMQESLISKRNALVGNLQASGPSKSQSSQKGFSI